MSDAGAIGERLAVLEAIQPTLAEQLRQARADQQLQAQHIRDALARLGAEIQAARQTDWKAILAAAAIVLTLATTIGGLALSGVNEQLALLRGQVGAAAGKSDVVRLEGAIDRMGQEALTRANSAGAIEQQLQQDSALLQRLDQRLTALEAKQ